LSDIRIKTRNLLIKERLMNKSEIKEISNQIIAAEKADDFDNMFDLWKSLVNNLSNSKQYKEIAELFKKWILTTDRCTSFQAAYALANQWMDDEAESIYSFLLFHDPDNTDILNNLSNIKHRKWEIEDAFNIIEKAYTLSNWKDEIIRDNYESLLKIINKKEETDSLYKNAESFIKKETTWAIEKLNNFLNNIEKEEKYQNNRIAIPKWKFKVLIWTDEQKADSLRKQWIEKWYIWDSWERDNYSVIVYQVNPYLKSFIKTNVPILVNKERLLWLERINWVELEKVWYFNIVSKIEKVNKKYKPLLKRDFDELIFNYLINNKKAVIILSWSFVELLFTYFCEKNKIFKLEYTINNKITKKDLYDCTLNDFLKYFEENKYFKQSLMYIGNLSRVFRNFIHPWNEIREKDELDKTKVELCFNSTIEFIKNIL